MISKNIDFYRDKGNVQLVVANLSGKANINYGEIENKLYFSIFETGSVKKIAGKPSDQNKQDYFLNSGQSEKNSIEFSFEKNKVLVLTCSLSFLGHVYIEEKNGEKIATQIAPVVAFPSQFLGVEDCFFQEKEKNDITNFYITEKDLSKFKRNGEEEESEGKCCAENDGVEPVCVPCPKYTYDIDIPIYGDIQYIKGPLSFNVVGPYIIIEECFLGGGGGSPLSCKCGIEKEYIENPPKFTTYINVNYDSLLS